MDQIITIGLDIAKNVFQIHGIEERGALSFAGNCSGNRPSPVKYNFFLHKD